MENDLRILCFNLPSFLLKPVEATLLSAGAKFGFVVTLGI